MAALVIDASAAVDLLLRNDSGAKVSARLHGHDLVSVAHLDAEVLSALARLHRQGTLDAAQVTARLELLADVPLERLPITAPLLTAAWRLRENVAARDALYVAASNALKARLVTTDRRLARAVGDLAVDLGA